MRISDWSSDVCSSDFCVGLVVLPTRNGGRPRLIDISHDLIMDRPAWYGWSAFPIGTPATITPRWLPGGRRIAYLKRADGLTQRSDERRVGKECVSTGRSWWAPNT